MNIHAKLQKAFPNKRFDLLYISPDTSLKHGEIVTELSENGLIRIISEYKSLKTDTPNYATDARVLLKILKKYRLNLPLPFKLKRLFLRLIISLIPIKSVRNKMKTKHRF